MASEFKPIFSNTDQGFAASDPYDLPEMENKELLRLDNIIDQLRSNSFVLDTRHPIFQKDEEIENTKTRRLNSNFKRFELSKKIILENYEASKIELMNAFLLNHSNSKT